MQAVHVILPEEEQHLLVFYLAMEEYVARHIDELLPENEDGSREAFFLWQVPPTVIFGRNQVMEAEVNLPYCQSRQIHLFRRKSGGGCVYSDMGNIMLSYITDSTEVSSAFDTFLGEVAAMLNRMGLDAHRSGRNDVMISGKKVSGNSLFLLPNSSIVHGTLLYDTDFEELERAITPSGAKISSKGVASVRQHVANVRELLEAQGGEATAKQTQPDQLGEGRDIETFKQFILHHFCENGATLVLSDDDVREIQKIEATYLDPDFLKGRNHTYSLQFKGRIEKVGEIMFELKMNSDYIEKCWVRGDIFPLKDQVDEALSARLEGQPVEVEAMRKALEGFPLEEYILNLHVDELLSLVTDGPDRHQTGN